jgi:DNA-directed RNA polymerase subunit RPC12/RpoP
MHTLNKRACPHCNSLETSGSHRHESVERYLLRIIGMLPYRCFDCDARFYAFTRLVARPSLNREAA